MNTPASPDAVGRVASLHIHVEKPGAVMQTAQQIEVIEAKGIMNEPRYFGRKSRDNGQPSKRQITLMEREQIAEHATTLGLESIPAGAVRSNIETTGIDLVSLIGKEVEIGEAILLLYGARDPCEQMDAICQGLRELMMNNRQGVLAQVIRSGKIQVGDRIRVRGATLPEPNAATAVERQAVPQAGRDSIPG
jgi:MOSC domain-containing protein YiiM